MLAVLPAHGPVLLQNVQHFSLERDTSGKVLLEDGKGRCPFDPEYRSTAVMVGKARCRGPHWGQTSTEPSKEQGGAARRVPGPSGSVSLADGELYAGTVSNFQGNEPTIYRSQESRIALKTENSLNWLQGESWGGMVGRGVRPAGWGPVLVAGQC